jgi:predicted MFS family arabinose efflux permease
MRAVRRRVETGVTASVMARPASLLNARHAYVALALIFCVVTLNYVDRYVLAILIEPIRAELQLTDTQIGLLTGAAFALLYSTLAIPVARLAERRNRVWILVIAILVWSTGTALSGLASGFFLLLLARMTVGCGEAGAIAPSMSMISDMFPIDRRSAAMGIIGLGGAAGNVIAPWIGSALVVELGWRHTFAGLGLLGIPLALLVLTLLREPQRGHADNLEVLLPPAPFTTALRRLFARRTFQLLTATLILMAIAEYTMILWMPSLFHRSFGVDTATLGSKLAIYQGVPLFLGTWLGGVMADKLWHRDPRWIVWVPMVGVILTAPAVYGLLHAPSTEAAFVLLVLPSLANGLYVGPCYALTQNLSAVQSRATSTAVLVFSVNLIGAGLGPLLIGMLSEHLRAGYGEQALRTAFLTLVPMYVLAAVGFLLMGRSLLGDLQSARRESVEGLPA